MSRLYILLAITIFFTCCKQKEENLPGTIYGVVTDKATGEPVKSAGVELSPVGLKTITGTEGQFEFTELVPGNYTLLVTKTGYMDYASNTIEVKPGQTAQGDVQLEKLPAALKIVNDKGLEIDELDFGAEESVLTRSFGIFNDSPESLEWLITENCEWITSISKVTGTLQPGKQQPVSITIDREKLSGGENTYILNITSDNGNKELIIKAKGDSKPSLNMLEVKNITQNSAEFYGEIISAGDPEYTERGFVYSTSTLPTVENTIIKLTAVVNAEKNFSASVSGLTMGKTYYVRAYAINSLGVAYSSNEMQFTTVETSVQLETNEVTGIDVYAGSAVLNATMINAGIPSFTERGFFYGTNMEPSDKDHIIRDSGKGTGSFSAIITDLTPSQNYFVRAYAIQSGQYVYGNTVTFNTFSESAEVVTSAVTNIGADGAVLNAYVAAEGNPAYTERGFCYSTYVNPTISNNKCVVGGIGLGDYSFSLEHLSYETTYYVRAYVIQNGNPVYGNVVSFTTVWEDAMVSTLQPIDVEATSATLKGNVMNVGSPEYSVQGFCYDTYGNPTINSMKVERQLSFGISGIYKMDITNLQSGVTYYVRAFLRQGDKVVYGDVVSFTTIEEPIVYTYNVSDLQGIDIGLGVCLEYSVQFNGSVVSVGTPAYTQRGFVYGTSYNPVVGSGTTVRVAGSGTGDFSTVTTVSNMKTYYVRAYVKTDHGYVYGNSVTFRTY